MAHCPRGGGRSCLCLKWAFIPFPGVVRKLLRLQGLLNFGLGSAKTLMIWNKAVWAVRVMEEVLRSVHPSLSRLRFPEGVPEPG